MNLKFLASPLILVVLGLALEVPVSAAPVDQGSGNHNTAYTVKLNGMVRDEWGCHFPSDDIYYRCPPLVQGRSLDTANETISVPVYTWPGSKVASRSGGISIRYSINYFVDERFRQNKSWMSTIRRALRSVEMAVGCMKFHEIPSRPGGGTPYLHYTNVRPGCNANIGLDPIDETMVNLGEDWCHSLDTTEHETLHAMGLQHEHSRADRDKYLWIDFGNISPENHCEFTLHPEYNVGYYDMHSPMHYQDMAGAMDPYKPAMVPKQSWNNPKYWGSGGCEKEDYNKCDHTMSE